MDAADGETAVAANEALIEAIIDFFPERSPLKAPLREYIRKATESQQAALQAVETEMLRIIEGLDISSALDHAQAPMNG